MTTTTPTFSTNFLRQLRHWTLHCTLNALPSFCIAAFYLQLGENPTAVMAMLSAIGTFIVIYATLTAIPGPFSTSEHLLARALRIGTVIRSWISVASLFLLPTGAIFFLPDFWCGHLAIAFLSHLAKLIGIASPFGGSEPSPDNSSFASVYATTMLEGIILSFMLLGIAFFAAMALQHHAKQRHFAK